MSSAFCKVTLRCAFVQTALLLSVVVHAQTAQVSGSITDAQSGVVVAATVSVENNATGAVRTTTSNAEGYYAFPALPPGSYTLRVEKTAFKTAEYPGVVLQADLPLQLDVTLRVGELTDDVTVQAAAPSFQGTPQIGMSVTSREYESLPMVQLGRIRSPASFVLLAPGVQGTVRLDGAQNANASNNVQVHGQANFTTEYLVNGLAAGPGYGNFNESAPAVGAVQEFRLITSQLTAEYGATGAAVASFVLRSGTNEVHGDAYDYYRNSALDGKSITSVAKPPLTLSEFGGSLGGPLVIPGAYDGANRSFFFVSYGGSRKRGADGVSTSLVPTVAERAGDFSGLKDSAGRPILIYDPATTRVVNGVSVRDPFPGNVIPANRIDPAAAAIAALYPAPNSPGGYRGEFGETVLDPDSFTATFDHTVSTTQHLSAALVRTDIPRVRTGTSLPDPLQGNAFRQHVKSWTLRGNHEMAIGSHLLNSLAVGYDAFTTPLTPPTDSHDWATTLHMPGLGNTAFPSMTFGNGYQVLGSTNYFDYDDNTVLAKDTLSWQKGAHLVKIGGEWRSNWHIARVVGTTQGAFSFTNTLTASPTALTTTGDSFASLLLGGYRSVSATGPVDTEATWGYGGSLSPTSGGRPRR
jgi:Carboxypeptidase regulatory-like domain